MSIKTESGHPHAKVDFPTETSAISKAQPAGVGLLACIPEYRQLLPANGNNFYFENLDNGSVGEEFSHTDERNEPLSPFWCFRETAAVGEAVTAVSSPHCLPSSRTLLFSQAQQLQETVEHYSPPKPQILPQLPPVIPHLIEAKDYTQDSSYSWDIKDIMLPEVSCA